MCFDVLQVVIAETHQMEERKTFPLHFRRCSASCSLQWRHQRLPTGASLRAFLEEGRSHWTEKNSVSVIFHGQFVTVLWKFHWCIALFISSVGESGAGKASRSLAQHIPGPGGIEGMKGAAAGIVGDLARARIALDERGHKLSEVEERTAAMMASADSFSKHAHEVLAFFFFFYFLLNHSEVPIHHYHASYLRSYILRRFATTMSVLFAYAVIHCLVFFVSCRWCWSVRIRNGTSSDLQTSPEHKGTLVARLIFSFLSSFRPSCPPSLFFWTTGIPLYFLAQC